MVTNTGNVPMNIFVVVFTCYEDLNISRCVVIGSTQYNATLSPRQTQVFPDSFGGPFQPGIAATVYVLGSPESTSVQDAVGNSWRYLLAATAIPSIVAIILGVLLIRERNRHFGK
ncbi:MAG: hypothetical protein KGI38_09040 [Thaumarchaeota archaeon]|nr:hypothetical protein [Nitrososphaerota archaeon]